MQPSITKIFQALMPLFLLGGVVALLLTGGPTKFLESDLPPIEEVHILRHSLEEDVITLDVINSGPDPVTIAQVMVRGAFWYHEMLPKRELNPLESAKIIIPFPWNEGEPVAIGLLSSTGLVFDYEIEVATRSPVVSISAVSNLALLGIYVGVIPVALGIFKTTFT